MVLFKKANEADAHELMIVQKRTFDDDTMRFRGFKEGGGPPGYDSEEWQRKMMKNSFYFKILDDEKIIGGMIIFGSENGLYVLGRFFIDPLYQNKGIGQKAMTFMHIEFASARKWKLETPEWAFRNHHFYEKMGYRKTGVEGPIPEGFNNFIYEKETDA